MDQSQISRIALGTAQFGLQYGIANQTGQVSLHDANEILSEAGKYGINTLDTAIAYGQSESVLGSIGVHGWNVISKLPGMPEDEKNPEEWVRDQVSGSLERLGVPKLQGLLLHRPDQLVSAKGKKLLAGLIKIKEAGLVDKLGVSIYEPEQLDVLLNEMDVEIVQAPLNILDTRMIGSGWATRLEKQNIELHVRSAFLQGLLLMQSDCRPIKFAQWSPLWQIWDAWLKANGLSPLEACIRFSLSMKAAKKIVIGVDHVEHLRQILAAVEGELPQLPEQLRTNDLLLINPAKWNSL